MTTKLNIFNIIFCSFIISGCTGPGIAFKAYEKKGVGLLGSPFGYTDKKLSNDSWFIEYFSDNAGIARKGVQKRALELCKENGFSGSSFSPKAGVSDGSVVFSGVSKCLSKNQLAKPSNKPESQKIIDRIKEIDVDIAAINDFNKSNKKQEEQMGKLAGITGAVNVFSLTDGLFDDSEEKEINKLKAERVVLINKLKAMSQ